MDSPTEDRATLAQTARETARGMAAAAEGHADDARVTVAIGQFRFIATMLAQLGDEGGRCSTAGCMGRPVDGFRFWVPHDQVVRLEAELSALRETQKFSGTLHY